MTDEEFARIVYDSMAQTKNNTLEPEEHVRRLVPGVSAGRITNLTEAVAETAQHCDPTLTLGNIAVFCFAEGFLLGHAVGKAIAAEEVKRSLRDDALHYEASEYWHAPEDGEVDDDARIGGMLAWLAEYLPQHMAEYNGDNHEPC